MTDHDGSRWYFPTYEGLYDAKHVRQMGQAIWLYGWMLARAHVAQDNGQFAYQHREAARDLGVTEREIMRWFKTLQEYGYVSTRARRQYHLEVEIANWRPVAEWLDSRHAEESDTTNLSHLISRPDTRPDTRPDKPVTPHIISIRLLGYEYPSPSETGATSAPPSLKGAFAWLLELQRTAKNSSATLAAIYQLTFGEDAPAYGFLGKAARVVGGAGRLVELFWQVVTRPPSGDVLGYVMKMGKGQGKDRSNGHRTEAPLATGMSEAQKRLQAVALAGVGEESDGRSE